MRDFYHEKEKEILNETNKKLEESSEEQLRTRYEKPDPRELLSKYNGGDDDDTYDPQEESEDIDDEDEDYEDVKYADHPNINNAPPKLITSEDFGSLQTFDTVSLMYYQGNDTLTTDDDEIVDDRRMMLGDCLTKYAFEDSDEKTIYVRNYELETDYEVIKIFGDYVE